MAVIKNLSYQPLAITDSKKTVILKGREKMEFENIDAKKLSEANKVKQNEGLIKVK